MGLLLACGMKKRMEHEVDKVVTVILELNLMHAQQNMILM